MVWYGMVWGLHKPHKTRILDPFANECKSKYTNVWLQKN
jgi:hypothetical protein